MKTRKFTTVVRESNRIRLLNIMDHIPPLIANLFSILFATSIIFELRGVLSGWVLVLLTVFIVLFLIQNEITKVISIRKVYSGQRNSLFTFLFTFMISVALSTIGMWFYTNKSNEIKDNSQVEKTIELNNIDLKYLAEYNGLQNTGYEDTKAYIDMQNEINYWKDKSAATLDERTEIRSRVDKLQNALLLQKKIFNENKTKQIEQLNNMIANEKSIVEAKFNSTINKTETNDFISYIFLSLILITEFATIFLNKIFTDKRNLTEEFTKSKFAKKYLIASNLLTSLYLSAKNNMVNINNAKYGLANKDNVLEWDEIKELYNIFISLDILSEGEIRDVNGKDLLFNEFQMDETQAQEKLDNYFERFFKVV